MPLAGLPPSPATASTALRIGPMHGVQPKANAMPITGGANTPSRDGDTRKRRSLIRVGDDTKPARNSQGELTAPLTEYYRSTRGNVVGVHADRPVEEVFKEIREVIDQVGART